MPKTKPLQVTFREGTIVQLLVQEKSEPAIAAELGIGHRTVNQHVRRMMKRNGIETRLGLVRRWEAHGGVDLIDGRKND